jgi:hypothetical protein
MQKKLVDVPLTKLATSRMIRCRLCVSLLRRSLSSSSKFKFDKSGPPVKFPSLINEEQHSSDGDSTVGEFRVWCVVCSEKQVGGLWTLVEPTEEEKLAKRMEFIEMERKEMEIKMEGALLRDTWRGAEDEESRGLQVEQVSEAQAPKSFVSCRSV